MSTFQQRRCGHCLIRYSYQTSGYGDLQDYNSGTYCPACLKVIVEALKVVPEVTQREWVGTSDVSAETLVEQEATAWEKTKAQGGIPVRRVLAGLYDLERPSNQHHSGIVHQDGRTYKYEYWTEQGGVAAGHVSIEVERDIPSGEVTGPWDLKDRWDTPPTFIDHPPWPERPPATHEFTPMPLTSLPVRRFDLIERSQSVLRSQEWGPVGRKSFSVEQLPDGAIPIYNKDPDIALIVKPDDKE